MGKGRGGGGEEGEGGERKGRAFSPKPTPGTSCIFISKEHKFWPFPYFSKKYHMF